NNTGKKRALYTLVDPISPPPKPAELSGVPWRILVEAPGTAPGSEWFIATAIYFHSRRTGTSNIGAKRVKRQCCIFRSKSPGKWAETRRIGLAFANFTF